MLPWKLIVTRSILFRAHILGLLLLFIVPPFTSTVSERKGCFSKHLQHRCLFDVTKHGYLFDGHQVCGTAVCSICASSFGNEGIFTCAEHSSTKENERPDVKDNECPAAKDNSHGSAQWTTRCSKNSVAPGDRAKLKPDEEKKKKERGVEYRQQKFCC